jgi:hypothetical protein
MTERKDEYKSQKWELQKSYAGYTGLHIMSTYLLKEMKGIYK